MTYIIWDPSGIVFDLGFYQLHWYSLCFALGFVLSYFIMRILFFREQLEEKYLERLTVYMVLATVIGARLGHCLFYDFGYYSDHILEIFLPFRFQPSFQFTGFQGLASHGGIFGVMVATVLFCRKYRINMWWLLDQLSIVGGLAGCCIRLGNLMNSEIVGKTTAVPWAFVFVQVDGIPRHPGQLYEALAYLLIFILLWFVYQNSTKPPGYLFGMFMVLLFTTRFAVEFVKADQSAFEAGMLLNMGQLLSIPFIALGIMVMVKKNGTAHPGLQSRQLSESRE